MSYVKDTVIVSDRVVPGADNTTWRELVIAAQTVDFTPGQFLMAAPAGWAGGWPSPLMIQRHATGGLGVLVHPDSPLYSLRAGDALTVWGPNGVGIPVEGSYRVLTDARGLLLVAPFLRANPELCKGLYLIGKASREDLTGLIGGVVPTVVDAPEQANLEGTDAILAALPLAAIAAWKRTAAPELFSRTVIYVGSKVGCGIGACRGCYIHGEPGSTGLAVCQEGPFLPMTAVDYQKDQNVLGHYV